MTWSLRFGSPDNRSPPLWHGILRPVSFKSRPAGSTRIVPGRARQAPREEPQEGRREEEPLAQEPAAARPQGVLLEERLRAGNRAPREELQEGRREEERLAPELAGARPRGFCWRSGCEREIGGSAAYCV